MTRAQTYWSDTIIHEATGVTYYFAEPVEYGHYWNGDIFVVSNSQDIVITKITPEDVPGDGRIMHGAMLQPDNAQGNGFDNGTNQMGGYQSSANIDPAATGTDLVIGAQAYPDGASLVKAVSLENLADSRDLSVIDKFSVLTVVPVVPPEGAFRPPVAGADKTSAYTVADLDFSKLQNVEPVSGQLPISDFDYLAEATYISWWSGNHPLRFFHPNSYHDGYNDYQLDDVLGAFMALHTNRPAIEKENVYAAVVQQGLDYAGAVSAGVRWSPDGGHSNLYKPFIVTAASALNSEELKHLSSAPGIFSEDLQFRYVEGERIGEEIFKSINNQDPIIGRAYQDAHLGMPEWYISREGAGLYDPSLSASYRWINSDNVPILALTMEMLGDGEGRDIWGHEAYFDYAERVRLMHEIDVNPTLPSIQRTHAAEADWMAFLDAYHGTYSAGANMQFRPESPLQVTATIVDGGLHIAIGGEVFTGSAPVERVDIRYRAASDGETWTVVEDFGMSGRVDGLPGGDVYFVQARYVNAIGEGAWSYNSFEVDNVTLIDRLKLEGFITDAHMDTFGGQRQYQKTEDYKDHLRSILAGDKAYEELADDLLAATVFMPPRDEPAVLPPDPEPEPIVLPEPILPSELLHRFDFNSLTIQNFQPRRQDKGDHGVEEDGAALRLDSQAWQSVLIDVDVTADTWLSFDFAAQLEGEIHGVMFTNGDAVSAVTSFNVFGTQHFGIQDYAYTGAGAVQRFDIHVGKHFTGSFDSVVFLTDDDMNVGADSVFANVALSSNGPATPLPLPEPEVMGVVQRVEDLTHTERTVAFGDGLMLEDVIVFATAPTFHGTDPASVAFDNVTATGATMKIREPDYLNGFHPGEDVALLAMEAGSWELSDGSRLEVGSMTLNGGRTDTFQSVTFEQAFDEAPVVLVQLQTSNGSDWAVLRTRDITTTGFQVALQEQEASDGWHDTEIVGWMALDSVAASGVIDWSGLAAQALTVENLADDRGGFIAFDATLGMDALITAGISSFKGSDTATLRLGQTQTDEVRTIAQFFVHEEQSMDAETQHTFENVSALAFAQEGTLSAIATPADLFLTGIDTDLG